MKKTILFLLALFSANIIFAQYCLPTYSSQCTSGDFINSFTLNTISNTGTGCSSTNVNNHTDYTATISTTLAQGSTHIVTCSPGSNWGEYFVVWIDFNQDGDFDEVNEFFDIGYASGAGTKSTSITIPTGILNGSTRLRVMCHFGVSPINQAEACSSQTFGETEDYEVIIEANTDPYDVSITANQTNIDEYTLVPLTQVSKLGTTATINNIGPLSVTNAVATVTVKEGLNTVYTASSTPFVIASGTNQEVLFPGFTPIIVGNYTTSYSVTIDELETDIANNTSLDKNIEITKSIYARDNGISTGNLGIGAGTTGRLGQQFDIVNAQAITSVTFDLADTFYSGTVTTYATIWSMNGNMPNAIVAQTDVVTRTSVSYGTYTANITGGSFMLAPGKYIVTLEESEDYSLSVATTTSIFTPNTTWVNFNNNWSNNEDFGFDVSCIIRPIFKEQSIITADATQTFTYDGTVKNIVATLNHSEASLGSG